jgi:hypothetical protein
MYVNKTKQIFQTSAERREEKGGGVFMKHVAKKNSAAARVLIMSWSKEKCV